MGSHLAEGSTLWLGGTSFRPFQGQAAIQAICPLPLQGPLKALIVTGLIPDARLAGSTPVRGKGPASPGGAAWREGHPPFQRPPPLNSSGLLLKFLGGITKLGLGN